MKSRVAVLFFACMATAFGQYTWDYTKNPVVSDTTRWSSNGSPSYGSYGANFSGSGGGSLISTPAISGSNSSDYEVTSTLALNSGGGTYIHFFRTSGGTVESGSGSYFSAEIVVPSSFTSPNAVTLNIKQCVNGTVTLLGSTLISAANGMTFRTIIFGSYLWVFTSISPSTSNFPVWIGYIGTPTTGKPGIGGYGMPSGSGFSAIWLGHHDVVAPNEVVGTSVLSSVFPNSVSLKWQGVLDDTNGIGFYEYYIIKNGGLFGMTLPAEFTDSTVQPSTTYTYTIEAIDFHGNLNAGTTVTVTTPPAGAIDPRRTGIYTTGSYWGGGGEQIDTLSGNLNFSLPLLTAQQRTGTTVPVGLVYNSQNWRQDNSVNWKLGNDVGFGFGWQMLIGSITPYESPYYGGIDHYVYTDSTGAQYSLTVNNGGVWSGTNGAYVWFDSNRDVLHFRDGSFWVMGCTSGGAEADAGTMYPTTIEDVSGNQVTVSYEPGAGLSSANTSARMLNIYDPRANGGATFSFVFNSDTPVPHMTYAWDHIGAGVSYSFTYNENVSLGPPFGSDPNYSGLTTTQLATMTVPTANPWQFTYDTAGASELLEAKFPWGGHLRWTYATDPYSGSRDLRAVSGRWLAADSAGATEWSYGISRDNASGSGDVVHGTMTLSDASGVGAKTWNFTNSGSTAWQIGLASSFVQSASSGGTVLQNDAYTWSQDPAGNPYISAKSTTIGQGTSNQQTALSTQTLDQYGNLTQSAVYPYGNTTTPIATYNNTYLNSSTYTSNYIFNRLVSSSVTPAGGSAITLATNTYDTYKDCTNYIANNPPLQCGGTVTPTSGPVYNMDPSPPISLFQRGYLSSSVTPVKTTTNAVYNYGVGAMSWGSDGTVAYASADSSTNFSAPVTIMSQSYQTTLAYNSWLGVTQAHGANNEQISMTYDSYGRPTSGTSAYCQSGCTGPTVSYSYSTSNPFTQTKTGPDGVTTTTLDGLGRAILIARGSTGGVQSYTSTVYAPCACSPLAKIQKVSMPYPYGSSASAWTTYSYDGLGRPLTVQKPDGASTTTYSYSGNVTTVTDPAGDWKQFTTDALNNLVTVVEPDPLNQPSGTLTTSYTYNWMNQVTGVSMTRAGTTQTRSFVYDNAGRLTSATNPENGSVSYVYGTNSAVQSKTDAKGQQTVYTYDSLNRLTMKQFYPQGQSGSEDGCQRVTYSYDTNPINSSFSQNSIGRLTAILYGAVTNNWNTSAVCVTGEYTNYLTGTQYTNNSSFAEMYSYHPAGGVIAKQLYLSRQYPTSYGNYWTTQTTDIEVDYTYDNTGRTATTKYPMAAPSSWYNNGPGGEALGPITLTYGYDSMGRPASLTDNSGATGASWGQTSSPVDWVQNVQYDYAGRMTSMQAVVGSDYNSGSYVTSWATRTMAYNVNGQLASLSWSTNPDAYGRSSPAVGIQYNYSATQNNGQITQAVDTLSGETISYQYDLLKRLTSASSTPNSGASPAPSAWTQTYQYDGFGNLTAKVLNGTSTPIAVNSATNRLSNASYDANGNMTSGSGATLTYDESNRVFSAAETSGGIEYFAYTADNKRFYTYTTSGAEQLTFYGARGENLGVYTIVPPNFYVGTQVAITPAFSNIWFTGKLIVESGQMTYQDRLGTNRKILVSDSYAPPGNGGRFYPYGDEITSTANDHEKFATYTRDSYTGFDYADQRYYASTYGRFNTPDPAGRRATKRNDPGSWNRYGYTRGDPVNRHDRTGLDDSDGDNGCVELDDGTYDCGVIATAEGDASGDGDGSDLFDDPEYGEECFADFEGCAQAMQIDAGLSNGLIANELKVASEIPAAVRAAISALNNPKCAKIFGVGVVNGQVVYPQNVLNNLEFGLEFGSITVGGILPTSPGTTVSARTTDIGTIDYGTAQYGVVSIVVNDLAGSFVSGSPKDQAITLLHELGHAMNYIFGPGTNQFNQNDAGDPGKSGNNTNKVKANCF